MTDEQLVAGYCNGDPTCFGTLMARHRCELLNFLIRFLRDAALAEDVLQNTFIQVFKKADTFDPAKHFRPWLFQIAANKARDALRTEKPGRTISYDADSPSQFTGDQFIDLIPGIDPPVGNAIERRELQRRVRRVVRTLPDHLREIILAVYFHQFAYAEVSKILGIPLGTVKSRLSSAVDHFAVLWAAQN